MSIAEYRLIHPPSVLLRINATATISSDDAIAHIHKAGRCSPPAKILSGIKNNRNKNTPWIFPIRRPIIAVTTMDATNIPRRFKPYIAEISFL